jgi:hypothetical protein
MHLVVLSLVLCGGIAVTVTAQQPIQFVSLYGRFSIQTGQVFSRFSTLNEIEINGRRQFAATYRWQIGSDPLALSYIISDKDVESTEPDKLLSGIREMFLSRMPGGHVLKDEDAKLDGHPGRRFIFEVGGKQTVAWAFIHKNRFYIFACAPSTQAAVSEVVKTVATFSFISRESLPDKYKQDYDRGELTALQRFGNVTNAGIIDLRTHELKGPVKEVVTKTTFEDKTSVTELLRERVGDDAVKDIFDESGAMIRSIKSYGPNISEVSDYGFVDGRRVYRMEHRRVITNDPKAIAAAKKDADILQLDTPQIKVFTLEYSFRPDGTSQSFAVVGNAGGGGSDDEKYSFDSNKTVHEYEAYVAPEVLDRIDRTIEGNTYYTKEISSLDAKGQIAETLVEKHEPGSRYFVSRNTVYADKKTVQLYRYKYDFDQKGNWIKRTKVLVKKNKDGETEEPFSVTVRVISYY